jgi:hypothetical protein
MLGAGYEGDEMQGWSDDFREGFRQARWGAYFLLVLFPLLCIALGMVYLIERRVPGVNETPTPLEATAAIVASAAALYLAARWDGPKGWLGRWLPRRK